MFRFVSFDLVWLAFIVRMGERTNKRTMEHGRQPECIVHPLTVILARMTAAQCVVAGLAFVVFDFGWQCLHFSWAENQHTI